MSQYRTCPNCGSHLDPGEVCDCAKNKELIEKDSEAERARQEAIRAEVCFHLEKRAGRENFHRDLKYSSGSAAVNGVAVLIRELAAMMGVSEVKILSLLAVVLTAPVVRKEAAHE